MIFNFVAAHNTTAQDGSRTVQGSTQRAAACMPLCLRRGGGDVKTAASTAPYIQRTVIQQESIADQELLPCLRAKGFPAQTAEIWIDVVSITELAD